MALRKDILAKLQRFCAYQERCHSEVRDKLLKLKVYGEDLEDIITELIKDDFLNEQRFAESYAGGKFRIKKWGKQKITRYLKAKKVSDYCIKKGLAQIEDDDYLLTLKGIICKYKTERSEKDWSEIEMNRKCVLFCQNKGYEYGYIKGLVYSKK